MDQSTNVGKTIVDSAKGAATFAAANWQYLTLVLLCIGAVSLMWSMFQTRDTDGNDGRARGVSTLVAKVVQLFGNWRLALLGATGIILSLASGWTTWDGMRNFTREPLLSLMITFGIQGVMLICAWLIGETFARGATGEGHAGSHDMRGSLRDTAHSSFPVLLGAIILGGLVGAIYAFFPAQELREYTMLYGRGVTWTAVGLGSFLFLAFVLIVFSKAEILGPYARGARIILANLHLWVMFLACMATSVFFSFDSLFSAIFPQEERARAAEIRTVNQVAAVVADTGSLIARRQLDEAEALFETPGWKEYDKHLASLATAAQSAQGEIERYFVQKMEEHRKGIAQQQERITSAQSGQAGLVSKKTSLTDELSRLKAERPGLAADHAEKKSALEARAKEIDAKRVEAMAEDRGVEGTGKVGKGPVYRQRMDEMARLNDYYKIGEERVKDAYKRLTTVDTRIAQIERELAAVDGDIAKLKGEAQTAEQRIKVAQETGTQEEGPKLDPARMLPAFERARAEFRQKPEAEKLGQLQGLCTSLIAAMSSVPTTKEKVRSIDCDPKQASEAAARVFALNAGLAAFAGNCVGGDKLPQQGGTTALLAFGRKCLQDSGLPSKDSAAVAARLSAVDLNRDDKAHRFVVTWNAFLDGNRLAYLAIAIAIAIDSLVFMSGLFGANAIASPLSSTPEASRRAVQDMEAIVNSALRPRQTDTAELTINLMEAIRLPEMPGFTQILDLEPMLDQRQWTAARKVVGAASNIGLVEHVAAYPGLYLIRRELHEYLLKFSENAHKRGEVIDEGFALPRLDASRSRIGAFLADLDRHRRAQSVAARRVPMGHGSIPLGAGVQPYPQALPSAHPSHQPQIGFHPEGAPRSQGHETAHPAAAPAAPVHGRPRTPEDPREARGAPSSPGAPGRTVERRIAQSLSEVAPADEGATADPQAQAVASVSRAPAVAPPSPRPGTALLGELYSKGLGLTVHDVHLLEANRMAVGEAVSEIQNLCLKHELIGNRIVNIHQKREQTIDRTCAKMIEANPGEQAYIEELAEGARALLWASMLKPRGAYEDVIRRLVEELAVPGGEGALTREDHERHQLLRDHLAQLAAEERTTPESWQAVADIVAGLGNNLSQIGAREGLGALSEVRPN